MSENEEGSSGSTANEATINRRDTGRVGGLRTGSLSTITARSFRGQMVEMEDVNFHHDSAVLLPDFGDSAPADGSEEQNRVTGLAVLYACYRQVREHPEQKLLIAGHTDRSGSDAYNVTLSQLRGDNILYALLGARADWVDICLQKHKVEDYQQILKWISYNWGWDCDPGPVNNVQNAETRQATRNFQIRYNSEFSASISESGYVGEATWGAFFDVYMRELVLIMGTTEAGLTEAQNSIEFVDDEHEAVGCGENFPITSDYRSATDRRVELLFFDPGEEPEVECLSPIEHCNPRTCEIYNSDIYDIQPVPVNPLPQPSGTEIVVSLKLTFRDPMDTEPEDTGRDLPQNFPVVVEFPDGTSQDEQVGEDGMLIFRVLREKRSFTLKFHFSAVNYIACPPSSAPLGQPAELITGSQVEDYHNRNHRLFSVPLDWNLSNSVWEVKGSPGYYTKPNFTGLPGISGNIGSDASPVEMVLDPHWQYLKFLYYDRFLKQKLSILPVMLEGFRNASSTSGDPDTHSNWVTDPQACQCLPWILQDPPRPDRDILLQFRTPEHTYIESQSGGSRSIVSGTERDTPSVDRLKYYDLPQLWKSSNYFARLSGGSGAAPTEVGVFASSDNLAGKTATDEQPLMFYMDDMVLTDISMNPIDWIPDTSEQNRVAIFCNTFDDTGPNSSNLSPMGLYKPDGQRQPSQPPRTDNKKSWFTERPQHETTRNYIADYPDWTRLVITQGNIFEVFDVRTREGSGDVVGARAAIRFLDVFASSNNFVPPGDARPSAPYPFRSRYCTIQPLFEQYHDSWWTTGQRGDNADERIIGRFDMLLLRCCDVEDDFEIAVAIHYFRFSFNFSPEEEDGSMPSNLTEEDADIYTDTCITGIYNRWNGDDALYNSIRTCIQPKDTTNDKLEVRCLWFVQSLPRNLAHFEVRIFDTIRASANSEEGIVNLQSNQTDKWPSHLPWPRTRVDQRGLWGRLTSAHEVGHCGSENDDYVDTTSPSDSRGGRLLGFDSLSPGSPFCWETSSMMKANIEIRSRNLWHVAEWLHLLKFGHVDYVVKRNNHVFELPHHPNVDVGRSHPRRSYINWPMACEYDRTLGTHGKFDVFLYPLGNDMYSRSILRRTAKITGPYKGIITVIVKMKFDFDIDDSAEIHKFLSKVEATIDRRFNHKYYVNAGDYAPCLLYFSPRYWADDYSIEDPRDTSEHIEIDVIEDGDSEWDSGIIYDNDYLLHFRRSGSGGDFATFFGNMIGLSDGTTTTAGDFNPIINGVIPGGSVERL